MTSTNSHPQVIFLLFRIILPVHSFSGGAVEQETGEDPSYFTAAFKHGSSHGGCNVNGPKVAKFLDG